MLTDGATADVTVAAPTMDESDAQPDPARTSYSEILKSSVVIGGSSVISLFITMLRTKAIAMILGPAGFGLMGLYISVADLTRSIAEMGINSSGVRQIAEAVGSADSQKIAQTVTILRRTAIALGLIGAALLLGFAAEISRITFGTLRYTSAIRLLSLAVFLRLVADGQGALIQGVRRLGDLAKINILSAIFGTLAAVPLVYWLGEDGVALSLVAVAATAALTSWHYSHKVSIDRPEWAPSQARNEIYALLRTGMAFMASGFLVMGTSYVVRLIIIRYDGMSAAGLYQAAWTIGGIYVGFILQAMGADFYPRLVALASDHERCNRTVNEQTQIGILIAVPGVLATICLAPLVIVLIYSREFLGAVDVLRWVCLGMGIRIVSWPIGFIVVAKGRQTIFFLTELAWTVVSLLLAWWSVATFGLAGAGIAFFLSYVFHTAMLFPVVKRLTGFSWSRANKRLGIGYTLAITLVIVLFHVLPTMTASLAGGLVTLLISAYSVKQLVTLVPPTSVPKALGGLYVFFKNA
jgi:antigen flippase